ncbi:unnamed protein product [Adineta steineri]|uniref:F-box domain-containing protein n=1 Tax=Adineta steineri TaxID=433720 RepID=A0A815PNH9_9BILA|nr:unnamed protein product [Adineta steineri]CAF1630917.1 unnamed protein product [Adineta steineri]
MEKLITISNKHHSGIELLSVELWREIFDYFNVNDLWYSFRGLNKHIDGIIDQVQLHLNLERKGKYDYYIKNILPFIDVVNIRSLKLRKHNRIKHFFSISSLQSLVQLRLLSLEYIYSFDDNLFTFWNQLSSLKYLRSLRVIFGSKFRSNNHLEEKQFIIRSIFTQDFCPLLNCIIIKNYGNDSVNTELPIPSLIQSTKTTNIKYLTIDRLTFVDLIELLPALQKTKSFCIDDEFFCNDQLFTQRIVPIAMSLMPECSKLDLSVPADMTFEHIEYILKHTPNLKKLIITNDWHLLDAKKWESLLSVRCLRLLEFELTCNGADNDTDYEEAGYDFEAECKMTTFWMERNSVVMHESYGEDDFYFTIVKFHIGKTIDELYAMIFPYEMDIKDDP